MYYRSLYPPVPQLPSKNYVDFALDRPESQSFPNYKVYINANTGEEIRRREFIERFEHAAVGLKAGLRDRGLGLRGQEETVGDGDIVGILSENCLEFPVLVWSLLKIGVPFALLPAQSTQSELNALAHVCKLSHLFVSPRLLPRALSGCKTWGLSEDKIYILQGRSVDRTSLGDIIDSARRKGAQLTEKLKSCAVRDDALAYLVFSSGTSGLPKAVMVSHRNLCYAALQPAYMLAEFSKVAPRSPPNTPEGVTVGICVLPMYHTAALHGFILRILLTPQTAIIMPKYNLNLLVDAISRYRVSHLFLVPTIVNQLLNSPKFATADFTSVASIGTAAAHLPVELREKFQGKAPLAQPWEAYGMSECTVTCIGTSIPGIFNSTVDPVRGMTGILLCGMEARIVREDGTEAAYHEPGELWVKGPNVVLGYWGNDKAIRETFVTLDDGPYVGRWLKTGDRFRADEAGRFFYIDRVKDTFKVSGQQVAPNEIEDVIFDHPDKLVTDVVVAGVSHRSSRGGGRSAIDEKTPRAWIVLSENGRRRPVDDVIATLSRRRNHFTKIVTTMYPRHASPSSVPCYCFFPLALGSEHCRFINSFLPSFLSANGGKRHIVLHKLSIAVHRIVF